MLSGSNYSLADIAAATGNGRNSDGSFGDGNGWWILIILFVLFGWGGNGYGNRGGAGNQGAVDNYVLASDFATIQRQLSDGFNAQERKTDTIISGVCDLGYTQQSLANTTNMNVMQGNYNTLNAIQQNGYESRLATQTLGSQLSNCCCDIRQQISDTNYNIANQANGISRQIERGFADTNYNMATQNCATLQAIDKVGDRIVDFLSQQETQRLRDEVAQYRAHANSQYVINELTPKCPQPAYVVQPPQNVTFPTTCGVVNYSNSGCSGCC